MATNLSIKKAYAQTEYTPESIQDLIRCKNDPLYFIEKFVKVQHPTKGIMPMQLYEYQKRMLIAIHENKDTIVLASRQLGKCVLKDTKIVTIEKPTGIKKLILKLIDGEEYGRIFGQDN